MTFKRLLLATAICLAGPIAVASARSYYPAYPYAQPARAPTPPSWSYDPYTSGAAPCPQGIHGDLQTCQQKMPPTYGQPSYWPTR
jgi:hypothetical protein